MTKSSPKYFLAKTDPETFSITDFEKEGTTLWDGVHNFMAINFIKQWQIGDLVFIYHSLGEASIAGLSEVVTAPRKNENDPRTSWIADLKLLKVFPKESRVNLKQVKESNLFSDFYLVRNSRLSVMPCPDEFVSWLREMGMEF